MNYNKNLDHIFKQTKREKLASFGIALIGLTLWVIAIGTLLELGSNN